MLTLILFLGLSLDSSIENEIREVFYDRSNTEEGSLEFDTMLKRYPTGPFISAYKAAWKMTAAQFQFFPLSKWMMFKEGREELDALVLKYPAHVDMRLIRLTVQLNAPSFLGYHDEIENDINFLKQQLMDSSLDSKLKLEIQKCLAR